MDIQSRPAVRRPWVPLAFREIHVPLPLTLGLIGAGLALGAWWLWPDFRWSPLERLSGVQCCRLAGFLFLVAVALSAGATLLAFGLRPLAVEKPQVAAGPLKRQFWDDAEVELTPRRGRNSAPPRRWLFLCGLAGLVGLSGLVLFAKGLHGSIPHWLFWGVSVGGFLFGAVVAYEGSHRWRFSGSVFRMESDFAVIGDTLQGCVFIRPALAPERGFRVRLCGVKTTYRERGANSEDGVWLDEAVIVAPLPEEGGGSAVPVCFEIPDHCPPSGRVGDSTYVDWYVEVSADTPAINCRVSFEVPVYHGVKTKRGPAASRGALLAPFEREVDGSRLYDNPKIRMRTLPGGDTEYYFPARLALGLFQVCMAVMVALGLIAMALIDKYALPLIDNNILTEIYKDFWQWWPIVPLTFILAIVFAGPNEGPWGTALSILRNLRATRIQTGPVGLTLIENWLGFRRKRFFDAGGILSVDLYWNRLSGNVVCYDLILKTVSGEKVLLATMLRGKPESRWIMEQMRRELFPHLISVDRGYQEPDRFGDGGTASTPQIDIPAHTAPSSSPEEFEQQLK